jgi:hypothetical protein
VSQAELLLLLLRDDLFSGAELRILSGCAWVVLDGPVIGG